MKSIFILGADTSVGKTLVSAGLLKAAQGYGSMAYWKPLQTGTLVGDDSEEVRSLAGVTAPEAILDSVYRFTDPMAAVLAAEKWGKSLEVGAITEKYHEYTKRGLSLIIEGSGGILAPLNDNQFQGDMIQSFKVPVLLIGEDRTGMVNQVLMTLRCAKEWKLNIVGVVLMNSRGSLGNAPAINRFGEGVKVIVEVPPMPDKRSLVAHLAASTELRQLIGVTSIPT